MAKQLHSYLAIVNLSYCSCAGNTPDEWQSATDLFVTNAANLMRAIKDTLRASKLAQELPNNYIPATSLHLQHQPPTFPPAASSVVTHSHPQSCGPSILPSVPKSLASASHQQPVSPLNKDHTATVSRCLYSLRAKWRTIGIFLEIDGDTLNAIEADNKDSDDRLIKMIEVWLKRHTPPPTWGALADALQDIDPSKAEKIIQNHL